MAHKNLFRVGQAAKELGTSGYKIRRLCESGLMPDAEWDGQRWYIPPAAVDQFKKEGLPPVPKQLDIDDADKPATHKPSRPSTLLAEPSAEMIDAAERAEMSGHAVTSAKNKLELKRMRKDEVEIDDYYREREKR